MFHVYKGYESYKLKDREVKILQLSGMLRQDYKTKSKNYNTHAVLALPVSFT